MKILLIGEYSNLHWTLANGLRSLGNDVTVVSDGDGFKNYKRDIDISLKSESKIGQICCFFSILKNLSKLKGYDVVQIINPMFTRVHRINLWLYNYLRKHNKKIFLGAFGDDYFYTKACLDNKIYRYSEFFVDGKPTNLATNKDLCSAWIDTFREKANKEIANTCNGIIACLCEYYMAYEHRFADKLTYIPLPIDLDEIPFVQLTEPPIIRFFIGLNRCRMQVKGSQLFLNALEKLKKNYPDMVEIQIAESRPYAEYKKLLSDSHVVLDQVYSYSTAMNGMLTLTSGKILVSGAEPEAYNILNEKENHPIVNIHPSEEDIYNKLEQLILHKADFPQISKNSRLFAEKHHNHIKVAKQYLAFWSKM